MCARLVFGSLIRPGLAAIVDMAPIQSFHHDFGEKEISQSLKVSRLSDTGQLQELYRTEALGKLSLAVGKANDMLQQLSAKMSKILRENAPFPWYGVAT